MPGFLHFWVGFAADAVDTYGVWASFGFLHFWGGQWSCGHGGLFSGLTRVVGGRGGLFEGLTGVGGHVAKEPHLTSATADHRNLCSTHAQKPHRMHPGPEQWAQTLTECIPGPQPQVALSCIELHSRGPNQTEK